MHYQHHQLIQPFTLDDTDTCNWPRPTPIPTRKDTPALLRDIPDLTTHLHLRLTTREPGAEPGGRKREAADIAPLHVTILQLLDDRPDRPNPSTEPHVTDDGGRRGTLGELTSWAHAIHEDHPNPSPLPGHTIAEVCSWLIRHHAEWADLMPEAAQEFHREVARRHSAMRRALGETDPVQLRHRHGDHACGHPIDQRTDALFQCRGCMQTWSLVEMMRQARWHSDVTLAEAADQLGIKTSRLHKWVERGKLEPVDDRRPARYRLRDITELLQNPRVG